MLIKKIKKCIKWFVPYGIVVFWNQIRSQRYQKLQKEIQTTLSEQRSRKEYEIKNYFLQLNPDTNDPEILEIIDYFKKYRFSIFPYEFPRKYHASDIDVFLDETTKTQYVMHEKNGFISPKVGKQKVYVTIIIACL